LTGAAVVVVVDVVVVVVLLVVVDVDDEDVGVPGVADTGSDGGPHPTLLPAVTRTV
jgi:hypothetical protein